MGFKNQAAQFLFVGSILVLLLIQIYTLVSKQPNPQIMVAVNLAMLVSLVIAWVLNPQEDYEPEQLVSGTVWANPEYENPGLGWVL